MCPIHVQAAAQRVRGRHQADKIAALAWARHPWKMPLLRLVAQHLCHCHHPLGLSSEGRRSQRDGEEPCPCRPQGPRLRSFKRLVLVQLQDDRASRMLLCRPDTDTWRKVETVSSSSTAVPVPVGAPTVVEKQAAGLPLCGACSIQRSSATCCVDKSGRWPNASTSRDKARTACRCCGLAAHDGGLAVHEADGASQCHRARPLLLRPSL